ncbi:Rrf2 family transcriptional regulator [uncultured Tateyamaria sp.]|uniref:RrF2 family transcriptional regulator n=1 Tax=uncultured Tateyamaria sp. TaxID=455651 RepID=UPI00263758AA|nr:Rrf2 family transcriptional regulator [uncultured Tateyamaria sp.]
MRLTSFTDYALRVLLYTAAHEEQLTTIAEIQKTFDISKGHLMKVVHLLSTEGYLHAVRGRSGGIRLGKAPEEINLGQLVRLTEPDFRLAECFGQENHCIISQFCKLPGPFNQALDAFFETLDGHSLKDMMLTRDIFGPTVERTFPQRGSSFDLGTETV